MRDTRNANILPIFILLEICWTLVKTFLPFANPNLQLTYCNRHIIRRIKLYCYYLNNRISNLLFGLWTFNLILITTSTNLQNKLYFIFLSKLNSEANSLVHFNVNITNQKHILNKSRCAATLSFRMFIYCGRTTCLGVPNVCNCCLLLSMTFVTSEMLQANLRYAFKNNYLSQREIKQLLLLFCYFGGLLDLG